ncbi:flippase [Chitinophaga sp. S165]|uniref:flippase n=1 Tax=Chitinophaga sp. S165 TaxID=2135462 RepID=UPI000D70D547|nr:flippase [Chitinophaga sp. S165]PWV48821.1 PST family polysaccharide transporter [Chitinophaga sp. S165]
MHKIFRNSGWLLVDKLARLFIGLITMAMIARHIGPEAFGIWNYAIALTAIVGSLAILGLDKVVVKEVVSNPDRQDSIIASTLAIRFAAGIIAFLCCAAIVLATKRHLPAYLYCTIITALNIIMLSFDVFDYFYQAKNEVHKVIIPKVTLFVTFCVIKIMFVYFNGTLLHFVWLSFAELLLTYLTILVFYLKEGNRLFTVISFPEMKYLFLHSWPLMFTGVLILLYVKADQLLLDTLSTSVQLGEYAAAARISELWYALPTVLATAILPGLISKRQENMSAYMYAIERWLRLSFWVSTAIAVVMTFSSAGIAHWLYGDQFPRSGLILSIHIWANIPVFLSTALMQYQLIEGAYKTNLYSSCAGLLVNIVINILLIPSMGGVGAAIATVVSYIVVGTTVVVLDKTGRLAMLIPRMISPALALADTKYIVDALKLFTDNFLSVIREKYLTK